MDHKLRILKSALVFLFLLGVLFGALALLPALAQTPQHVQTAPDQPLVPKPGDVSAQMLLPSKTGYVVDDGALAPYFKTVSPLGADGWTGVAGAGWDNDFLWTVSGDGDLAEWHPDLADGWYKVYVHYYAHPTRRNDVEYKIYHAGGVTTLHVNQQLKADGSPAPLGAESGWYSLGGPFHFRSGAVLVDYVRLTDITTTWGAPAGGLVIADAVKFAPMEVWVDDNYCSACPNDGRLWGVTAFDNMRSGIEAVADDGTVHVGPGGYYQYITVTKSITLTGAGPNSTVISVTSVNAAMELLAKNVRISGFTIEGYASDYGIVNRDFLIPAWVHDLTGLQIANNVIRGFQLGAIRLQECSGVISGNVVYNNSQRGIWLQRYPDYPSGALSGPTTVSGNHLHANGGGANDYDIDVEDSYTNSMLVGNVITGSLGASEAAIRVFNKAGDLTLARNTVTGSTKGVWVLTNDPATNIAIQKVNLYSNTITGGGTGVHLEWVASLVPSLWQTVIGGSLANHNHIYGNTGDELTLTQYGVPVAATYNYWGMCTLRDIENQIYHNYDLPTEGVVSFEPAICVPNDIVVQAAKPSLPADGESQTTITATVVDIAGDPVRLGTMVGITTSSGSVPYGYVEENDPSVIPSAGWAGAIDAHASGGAFAGAGLLGANMRWTFSGTAVSLIYLKLAGGGAADVFVDDFTTPITTVNMSGPLVWPNAEWLVEDVISNALGPGPHTIEVRAVVPPIWVDALRSGGAVATQGRITTTLTSAVVSDTAKVWGTVYTGRIITTAMPTPLTVFPVITDSTEVTFRGAELGVFKKAWQATLTPGKEVSYTITYSNTVGPQKATNAVITDTLPSDFEYLRYLSTPNLAAPNLVAPGQYLFRLGDVAPGATGFITIWVRPKTEVPWPSVATIATNTVEISSKVADIAAGNNITLALVYVVPGAAKTVTVTAVPTTTLADGAATVVITAEVRDIYSNPILDGTPITFTTNVTPGCVFQPGDVTTQYVPTSGGFATTTLRAGTVAGTAVVTANAGTARNSTQVRLLPLEPYWVYMSAQPPRIRVSNYEITTSLRITVTDQYGNRVDGASVALTTTAGSLRFHVPDVFTSSVTTTNGIAFASLASTQGVTTATVTAAITTSWHPTTTMDVFFIADVPYTITSEAYPEEIRVCGESALVTVTVRDRFDNPVEDGTSVNWNVVQGDRGDMDRRLTTTVNGVATSTVRTKGYLFGSRFLDVYIVAEREARRVTWRQPISLTVGLPDKVSFTITPSPVGAGGKEGKVEARVRDCAGNKVQDGTAITFEVSALGTITPTNTFVMDGLALTTFKSGCVMGTAVITATSDSKVFTTTLVVEPGPADHIFVDVGPATIRNCGGRAVVTATLYDACNNLVKDNTTVLLTPQFDYVSVYVSGSPSNVALTRHGVVTATVIANRNKRIPVSDWPYGVEQVNVTSGSAMPGFANLTILPGSPANINVSTDPGSIHINGDVNGYDILVGARVSDCSGTPVEDDPGRVVRFQTDKGIFRESGSWFWNTTTAAGLVTATLTSQSVGGQVKVSVTANSAVGSANVVFLPDEPWLIQMWSTPTNICASGSSTSTVTARVFDAYDNPVLEGVTVTFVTDFGHFAESGDVQYATTTYLDGFAFATLVSDTSAHTALVRAIAYNDRQGYTYVFFETCRYLYMPIMHRNFVH